MNTLNGNVIHTQELTKTYKGVNALQGLSLKVPKISIYGFLGPNGAGKSTTIKMLLGLTRPTAGKALIFGKDITQESLAVRRKVGYLAQDPRYYEHMTARQTLRYTARFFYNEPKDLIEARIEEMLDLVGLDDKADRPIKGFSGGERQRLGIAQAEVNYPDLLILDEPAAALDPMGRHDVLAVMEKLRKYTTVFYSIQTRASPGLRRAWLRPRGARSLEQGSSGLYGGARCRSLSRRGFARRRSRHVA
jgi:ABC-2 type transport system ATP-binding protein